MYTSSSKGNIEKAGDQYLLIGSEVLAENTYFFTIRFSREASVNE